MTNTEKSELGEIITNLIGSGEVTFQNLTDEEWEAYNFFQNE